MNDDQQFLEQPAIRRMLNAGLRVKEEAYGFSIENEHDGQLVTGQCGNEHNGSISISFTSEADLGDRENRLVHWFFRFSMAEMADFLIAAHTQSDKSQTNWWSCLQSLDEVYDNDELESRLRRQHPDLWRRIDAGTSASPE